jgi:hypothetical protein
LINSASMPDGALLIFMLLSRIPKLVALIRQKLFVSGSITLKKW